MNETKSKALLIVSLVAILAVSISTVVLHALYPPEHETLEVLCVEETDEVNERLRSAIVWLRWFGDEKDLGVFVQQKYSVWLPYMGHWSWVDNFWWENRTVSYECVFSVTLPHSAHAQIYYDEVKLWMGHNGNLSDF